MTDFEQRVLEDLSALKVQVHQLMGIGQPGRMQMLEERVECHERKMQRLQGMAGAFGGVLAFVQFVFLVMKNRQ